MIAEDPKSIEVIKPAVRGRDVRRWTVSWANKYLLFIPWHFPLHHGPSIIGNSNLAESAFKREFPAVYGFLRTHRARLEARNKAETGIRYEWYALQRWAADYHQEFAREKLLWIELVEHGRFAFDDSGMYGEATTFMMTGKSLKYILAVLNSPLSRWYIGQTAPTSGMGTLRWKKVYVEGIPIPKISEAAQRPFVEGVDNILSAKESAPEAEIRELEAALEELVFGLYGLTDEEISQLGLRFQSP